MTQDQDQFSGEGRQNLKVILLVEDDRDIGEVLVEAITHESPYQAMLATDGFEALHMVQSIKPGLFILDYQLPGMNGVELYDKLHAIKALADVPALMMSARLPRQELEKRKIVGMNKPVDLDEFLQTLDQLLA
ncbi:MAG TPA: response regulator [Ktedonobacteraceae bacterium]|nr:response regulator [Ktedonobacteraceae bacterium]